MTQEAQLKSCPHCGDKDDYNPSVSRSSKYAEPGDPKRGTTANLAAGFLDGDFYVECDKCGACGPPHETEAGAVELWNTRIESGVVAELKEYVVAFCGPWAVQYSRDFGLPDGHLHPTHYDILEKCGARMNDFTRAKLEPSK